MKITIKNSKIIVAGETVLDNTGKNDSVIIAFVCPNGCSKGFIELKDNY